MRMFTLNLMCALLTLTLLSGCEFKDVELDRVEAFEINSIEEGRMDGTIQMVLTNPNSFPITIRTGEFKIYTGKVHMGDASLTRAVKISSNSTETYRIDVNGTVGDLVTAGLSGLAGLLTGKKPEMTIKGELKAGYFLYTKTVPVELKTEVPLQF